VSAAEFDVIVAGLGVMGASALHALAERGANVLGIDRFNPPHTMGSSHGRTRIFREAYYEHPMYVPLVRRALEHWRLLQELLGTPLLRTTGGLSVGPADGQLVRGATRSARIHGVTHEILNEDEIRQRFPDFRPPPGSAGLYEPDAGLLFPESCIASLLQAARLNGAELETDDAVIHWTATASGVRVDTGGGRYDANTLVLTAGAWLRDLAHMDIPLRVERQFVMWFDSAADASEWPFALWEATDGTIFATFPDLGDGVKAQLHHSGETTTADAVNRTVMPEDEARVRALLSSFVPAANGARRAATVCLYTNTPDTHFLIDKHPDHENVIVVSACSGHGFKFGPAIGELLADMALKTERAASIEPFRIARFR
jgi:sarcosine oxidase